jgi:hypothetical protein
MIIYDVSRIREGDHISFKKHARLANPGEVLSWCCSHSHVSWNEAAQCIETPLSGHGEFLDEIEQN